MKPYRTILTALVVATALLAAACRPGGWATAKPYQETQFLMDTVIEITAYGPGAEQGVKAAFAEFSRLHDLSNRFDPGSQVSMINRMAGKEKVKVDPELIVMIGHSAAISEKLDGAFDITVGALTDLWGVGNKGDYVPTPAEIEQILPLVDYRLIRVDAAAGTVFLPKPGMKLDLGGIAKGYALTKAVEKLKAAGVTSALVNAGGDIRVIGAKPDGAAWRIGVQDPRNPDNIIAKIALKQWDSLQTSGDYQRFFIKDGVRYSHILDPKTGRQPRGLASITLVYRSEQAGDIASSGLFVLGPGKGLEALRQLPGVEAIMVADDGRVIVTPGLEGKVELGK
jgi:thiamine biosynthesis lipoprotein